MPSIRIGLYILFFVLGTITIGMITLIFFFYDKERRPVSGRHALLGHVGRAKQAIPAGKLGRVYFFGELWDAICEEDLMDEQAVRVVEVHEKFVKVVPSDQLPDTI